ncbi:MAG: RNA polymerase sigma-70 factor [Tannerella sp.]|jgi:RNA polymerase sigma-70 factor (ECF subfamily)|nr:RNA polymerase sigma-70 factor [Tannerella sp.]
MDAELELKYLKRLGDSDHNAFDILFTEYYPKVRSFLFGFIKDQEIASDLTQDVFFKVWVNRESISRTVSFRAYLFRMARNLVYDYYEHINVVERYNLEQRERKEDSYSIDEEIYAGELSLLIDAIISKMPPQRKRIFVMSRQDGLSNDEIADALNINKRTVENHITQALHDIKKELYSGRV